MSLSSAPAVALNTLLAGFTDDPALPEVAVTGLCLDSRLIRDGDLYFALRGSQAHGIEFAPMAERKGAVAVLIDSEDALIANEQPDISVPVVPIPELSRVVGSLASRYFDYPSRKLSVCGVTGTDGKTSVCQFVAEALRQLGHKVGYIGTIGWGIGDDLAANPLTTPDAITLHTMINDLYQQGAEYVALEVSSHALVQSRVGGIEFDVAVLTNLGRDHLDYHGDLDAYKAAKAQLFDWPELSAIVVNLDDEFGCELAAGHADSTPVTGFSRAGTSRNRVDIPTTGSFNAEDVVANENGIAFTLDDGRSKFAVSSSLLGEFNVDNLLACFAVLRAFGVAPDQAADTLGRIRSVNGRMERFSHKAGAQQRASIVVDFAHTPQALQAALKTLRSHCHGKLWVVFGCGGDRDPGKRALMGEVAAAEADMVVVTDDNPRTESSAEIIDNILSGIPQSKPQVVLADRAKAIEHAVLNADRADWVLIAGKGHEDYQIIGTEHHAFSDREIVQSLLAREVGS